MGNKCREFKTDVVECPSAGVIESFEEKNIIKTQEYFDGFCRRGSPICE